MADFKLDEAHAHPSVGHTHNPAQKAHQLMRSVRGMMYQEVPAILATALGWRGTVSVSRIAQLPMKACTSKTALSQTQLRPRSMQDRCSSFM